MTHKGTEEIASVLISTLYGREKAAVNVLVADTKRLFPSSRPTKATWCSLLCDRGLDLKSPPTPGEYIDAETIPAVLDAAPLQIRMSNLIYVDILLEMTLVEVNEMKRVLDLCPYLTNHLALISNRYGRVLLLSDIQAPGRCWYALSLYPYGAWNPASRQESKRERSPNDL